MSKRQQIMDEIESAKNLEHPYRWIRLTLEDGHFKLAYACDVQGSSIGFSTECPVCIDRTSRLIVNEEETGVLGRIMALET